jgi:hypothetical protein
MSVVVFGEIFLRVDLLRSVIIALLNTTRFGVGWVEEVYRIYFCLWRDIGLSTAFLIGVNDHGNTGRAVKN